MSLQLAVLDMVGTTVHAGDEVPAAFREAFRSVGTELDDATISEIRGRSKREAIHRLLAERAEGGTVSEELAETIYRRFQVALQDAYGAGARAVEGAESVFRFLREAGVQVVLSTGLDRSTAGSLVRALGWEELDILDVLTGDDVARGRPAPDLLLAAMERASVPEARCVAAVGDTTADLAAAAAAGVGWSVGVLTGAHTRAALEAQPHSVVLPSVAELPAWLTRVGALGGGA